MYHKNKSLCFYVSQVSLKSFLGSERQGGSTGYASAVDFRSLQFHNKIASFAVAAHTLEPLLVEYLFVSASKQCAQFAGLQLFCGFGRKKMELHYGRS